MPIVRIEDPVHRTPETRQAIIETVYRSLRQVFKVSDEELQARYHTYASPDFRSPGDCEAFLQVEITVFKGRTLETKRRLYQAISQALSEQLHLPAQALLILLDEREGENWGMRGGIPACEIDFGYAIDI